MVVFVIVIILIVIIALFRSGVRPKTDSQGRVTGVRRVQRQRHVHGGLIGRKGHARPAEYCPDCGKLKAICRRDEADATHAAGMIGPRKKK